MITSVLLMYGMAANSVADEEAHQDLLRVAGDLAAMAADADQKLWEMYRRRIGGVA